MSVIEEAVKLPVADQLALMETLWDQLNKSESITTPDWHQRELEITDERVKAGLEEEMDWDIAKKSLRAV